MFRCVMIGARAMFLRHRTFIGPFMFTPRGTREAVRGIAQRFANEVVGVENIVSVVEHAGNPFCVVVWFRSSEAEQRLAARVYVTNDQVRAIIDQSPDRAFPTS